MRQPKVVKHVLFRTKNADYLPEWCFPGKIEEQEALVYDLPMLRCQHKYSAGDGWRFVTEIEDEALIMDYTPYYVAVIGVCETRDLDDVRKFYEQNMRCEILEWVEIDT